MSERKLSVLKPNHATWLVEMHNFFTSAQERNHVLEGCEKAGIKGIVTGREVLPPVDHIKKFTLMARGTCIYVSKLHYVTERYHFFFGVRRKEFSM